MNTAIKTPDFGSNILLKLKYKMETALIKLGGILATALELFRSNGMFVIEISKGGIFIVSIP